MPYVNVKLAGTLSKEQKAKIAEEITDTLERVANKPSLIPTSCSMRWKAKIGQWRVSC